MSRRLQKKFILSAMLAVTILLVLLLGAINIGNICVSGRQSRQMLAFLLKEEAQMQLPPEARPPKRLLDAPSDENLRRAAIYFTVWCEPDGSIRNADVSRISGVTEREAAALCRAAIESGKSTGKLQNFRYQAAVSARDGSAVYLFLDTAMQLRNTLLVLLFSIAAGILCWLIMLLLVILISKRAIRPFVENMERQKQFVTDAGHEIKTPLAIILANTEAMELYQGETKWSKNIREQTVRLTGLMQELLSLARADELREAASSTPVCLSDTVLAVMQMFEQAIQLKQLRVSSQIAPGILLRFNSAQLQQLVSILLDNAVKYTPQNGAINIVLARSGKGAVLRVMNSCQTLPDCPPETLFDRFYRADAARTHENGGYGIGLSAAKTITALYGGSIHAAYHPPEQIEFTIQFP